MKIIPITPHFAVTGALRPEDFPAAAALGFKSVVSNLPEGELPAYPTSAEEAQLAHDAGLGFRHVAVTKHDVFSDRVVGGMTDALHALPSPVLAHCASGMRSAVAWAAAASRSQPAGCVLERLEQAGFNLAALREELEAQHRETATSPLPPALDAACNASDRNVG